MPIGMLKRVESIRPFHANAAGTFSVSVDCDAIAHYLNFAPPNTRVGHDPYSYAAMGRQLLDLFNDCKIKATFFCIADQLDDSATLMFFREAVRTGHNIGNHTYSHPDLAVCSPQEHLNEIEKGHALIVERLGVIPVGYRAPAYFITEDALLRLAELGYRYDTSVSTATLTRWLLKTLSFFKPNYRVKKAASLHNQFGSALPSVVCFKDGQKILEWPIPVSLGLNYYGTFHCVAPKAMFFLQTNWLRFRGAHVHYELHPIELITPEALKAFPWLRNIPFADRADLFPWLQTRLRYLSSRMRNVTLEAMTDESIHLLYN